MNWLKKGNLLALGVAFGLFALALVLFLDPLLKRALISGGQAAAGAKVEVASLKTALLRGRLELRGVAVADKNAPMKNLFELDEAALSFSPAAALRAKTVIPEAALRGLRFGTARRSSGALPRAKPSALERMIQEQLAPAKGSLLSQVGQAKTKIGELDPKKLASLEGLKEAESKLAATGDKWKDKVGVSKIEDGIKSIEADIKELQKGGDPLRQTQNAQRIQGKVRSLLAEINGTKASVERELGEARGKLAKADELRKKDVQGLLEAAGLPSLDPETLTRRLLGPQAAAKLSNAMYWIARARKLSSSPAQKAAQKPPRRRGVDFEFPLEKTWPQFLLEKAELTGTLGELELQGTLLGVNSNPPLYGKPSRLSLKGRAAGGRSLTVEGLLDQTGGPGRTELSFQYAGLPLAGAELGEGELAAGVKAGTARLSGSARVVGERWKGQVVIDAQGVALEPRLGFTGPAAGFAASALKSVSRFTATIGFEGSEEALDFKLSSDLGRVLADGIKKGFSAELDKQRKLVEQKVDALYQAKARELNARIEGERKKLLAPLEAQQRRLEEQLKQATGGALKRALPGFDKLFKRR